MVLHGSQTTIGRRYVIVDLKGLLLETGQTVTQHVEDDGDLEHGLDKAYIDDTPGTTADLDVAHYCGDAISFAVGGLLTDGDGLLAGFAIGDEITIRGSTLNEITGTLTGVAGMPNNLDFGGGVLADEGAPASVSLYKQIAQTHNMVFDRNTGLTWSQLTTEGLKVGITSDGLLVWYNGALTWELHAANADLSIVEPNILQIDSGAGEIARYNPGDAIVCTILAAPMDIPGYRVTSVAVSGANLHLVLDIGNNTLAAEGPGVNGTISLVCQSIFAYASAANEAELGGHDDWRVPNLFEMMSLYEFSAGTEVVPDLAAFPGWPHDGTGGWVWVSTEDPSVGANANSYIFGWDDGTYTSTIKTATHNAALVRGG